MTNISLWQPDNTSLIPATAKTAESIANCAAQLKTKDRTQIIAAFKMRHFEMALNYVWLKTTTALKKELSAVGMGLLGEMLGKADVSEDDDVEDVITNKEAIMLAEQLGVVSATDGLRLKQINELINHFSQMNASESEAEDIDELEAISYLKTCVKSVLGRPTVEVSKKFVEFREALEGVTLSEADPQIDMLVSSPYFFCKLTVSVLLNAVKKNTGANLEHSVANLNVIIPKIWSRLRDSEKWQVGHAYAEAYADGKTTSFGGLKSALLKVRGFDYVPENLRSDTFVKAAEAIVKAHEGLNNFYNEPSAVKALAKLGTTIPTPALPACITALLCVAIGNSYGISFVAAAEAKSLLSNISSDRWSYYFNNVFPSDMRIIDKLRNDKPRDRWCELSIDFSFSSLDIRNSTVSRLLRNSASKKERGINASLIALSEEYYGKVG